MREINLTFESFGNRVLPLGIKGENLALQVSIDCATVLTAHPTGHAALTVNPPEGEAYPGEIWMSGNTVLWQIRSRDLLEPGRGTAVLNIVDSLGTVLETVTATTVIQASVPTGILPEQIEDWLQSASVTLKETQQALLDIDTAIEKAKQQSVDENVLLALERIENKKNASIAEFDSHADETAEDEIDGIQSEGATQIAAVEAKGQEVLGSIPEEYTELSGDVTDLKSAIEYISDGKVFYPYDIVPNSYVKTDGSFAAYNGWSRTGYIAVEPGTKLYITNPVRAPFSAWYNANYEFVSCLDLQPGNPVMITVPADVYYLAISAETNDLFTAIWSYIPLVDDTLTQAHKAADAKVTGDIITNIEEDIGGGAVVYTTPLTQRISGYYTINSQTNKIVTSASDTYYTIEPVDISMLKLGSTVKMKASLAGSYGIFIVDSGLNVLDYINGENAVDRGYSVTSTPVLVSMAVPANAKYIVSDIRNAYYVSMDDFNVSGIEKSNITVLMEKSETANGNVLHGKKWVACGDSFTEGDFHNSLTDDYTFTSGLYAGENKVYPFWIGRRNPDLTVINEAISGSTMGAGSNGVNPFSGTRYTNIPSDADYITLMFGINDNGHGVPIGTINDNDNTTFYGAWNVVLAYFIKNFPFAHIGIIIGPGMQTSSGQNYANAEIAIAKKWGIPYLNIQFESGGGKIPLMLRTSNPDVNATITVDGETMPLKTYVNNIQYVNPSTDTPNYHPNEKAHELESYFIEAWLRTI